MTTFLAAMLGAILGIPIGVLVVHKTSIGNRWPCWLLLMKHDWTPPDAYGYQHCRDCPARRQTA